MRRLLIIGVLPLLAMFSACSNSVPSARQVAVVDSFMAQLNARQFDALYELHSAEFKGSISRTASTQRYEDFRAWAGACKRLGDPALGVQEVAGRRLVVVHVLTQCDCGELKQEFVLGDADDAERITAFRWKAEQA
jgi:hypothetical protein